MDPSVLEQLAKGVLSPHGMALILLFIVWFKIPRNSGLPDPNTSPALSWRQAIAPMLAAIVVLASWPFVFTLTFPPADTFARTPWIWLGVAIALTGVYAISNRWFRTLAVTTAVLIAAPFVIPAAQLKLISNSHLALQAALLAACSFLSAGWIPEIARKSPRSASMVQCIILTGACQVLILGFSSLKLGQAAGMLGAISGAFMVLTLWKNRNLSGPGLDASMACTALLAMFAGVHSTDTARPWLYIFLIAAAPVVSWLAYKVPLKTAWLKDLAAILAAVAMVAVALGIAISQRPVDEYQAITDIR